jgi:hypothetical protein
MKLRERRNLMNPFLRDDIFELAPFPKKRKRKVGDLLTIEGVVRETRLPDEIPTSYEELDEMGEQSEREGESEVEESILGKHRKETEHGGESDPLSVSGEYSSSEGSEVEAGVEDEGFPLEKCPGEMEAEPEEEFETEEVNWTVETQQQNEDAEYEAIASLMEETTIFLEGFRAVLPATTESVLEQIYKTPWVNVVDLVLNELMERNAGKLLREEMILIRAPLDRYWSGSLNLTRIGLTATNDYLFWHSLMKENVNMELIASIAAALVSCPASEAQCERGFSFLHYVMRRERNRLSLKKLYESMVIKDD